MKSGFKQKMYSCFKNSKISFKFWS